MTTCKTCDGSGHEMSSYDDTAYCPNCLGTGKEPSDVKVLTIMKPATIINGILAGKVGTVVGYDSTRNIVTLQLDDVSTVEIKSEHIHQAPEDEQLTWEELASDTVQIDVIIDIGQRWEEGIPHDPRSEKVFHFLKDYDFHHAGDYFCFKQGGDGDNGEHLMYLLDEYFANKDIADKTPPNEDSHI